MGIISDFIDSLFIVVMGGLYFQPDLILRLAEILLSHIDGVRGSVAGTLTFSPFEERDTELGVDRIVRM